MFSNNNPSPQKLAFWGAVISTIFVFILLAFVQPLWWIFFLILSLFFGLTYALFLYIIQRFIQHQIRLIYKLIAQTKSTKKEDFYNKNILPDKSIEDVQKDVVIWAEQRKKEIDILQQNEVFRKEFLQNLSHELKTPIFSIQGYIETLLSGAINNSDVNIRFLQNASKNVERLTNLVNDLDEISKLESGALLLQMDYFSINDLILEVYESLELKAKEKAIACTIKKESSGNYTVYADQEKIRQVLTNLVDNAIKYGKQNGKVEAGIFSINKKEVLIEITDNGSGISEEHRLRIFERFYRTDWARSRKIGGSGLGLSICKHIVEAHEKEIHVRSTLDVGSTFVFSLSSAPST